MVFRPQTHKGVRQRDRNRVSDQDVRADLRRRLRPEFINRVRMIHFNRLTQLSAERILDLEFDRIARRYDEVHGVRLVLDPSAHAELISRGFSPIYVARHLASVLESVCNVELAKKVRRDDRSESGDRQEILTRIREMRAGDRPFDAETVKRQVSELSRAQLDYDIVRIAFRDDQFEYLHERSEDFE